jgi:hypothetical protein
MAAATKSLKAAYDKAYQKTLKDVAEWFVRRCTEEIEADKWPYLTQPKMRDIVASGRLRDSVRIIPRPGGAFDVVWEADYSTEVHEGVTTLAGVAVLARPWTREPLKELPAKFAELLQANIRLYAP